MKNLYLFMLTLLATFLTEKASALIEITQVHCICATGKIEVTAEPDPGKASAGPFTFEWSGPGGYTSSLEDPDDIIIPGAYTVTVTNAYGCATVLTTDVEKCFTVEPASVTCVCAPGGYGSAVLAITHGTGPYLYQWQGPNNYHSIEAELQAPAAGLYTVTVHDEGSGCQATAEVMVENCVFDAGSFPVDIEHSCDGPNSGAITIAVPPMDGVSPYIFTWSRKEGGNEAPLTQDLQGHSSTISGLAPGEYCVRVQSFNGCESSVCGLIIEEYAPPTVEYSITPASSPGAADGGIALQVSGGAAPYKYKWSTGATGSSVSGLTSGIYCVTVSYGAAYKCSQDYCFEVHDCEELSASFSPVTEVFAPNDDLSGAYIDLTLTNLQGYVFEVNWISPDHPGFSAQTEDIYDLFPGTYCCTIQGQNCNLSDYLCVNVCDFAIFFSTSPDPPSLHCDGILLTAGAAPVNNPTYQWSNGASGATIAASYGQTYCVTVTDATGCSAQSCFTPNPEPLNLSLSTTNATFGNSDGSATATTTGGVLPYTYLWSNGGATATISGIPPGEYCVTVTDHCGATTEGCVEVHCEFGTSILKANITPVNCETGTKGAIDLVLLLQLSKPKFLWSTGATTEDISQVVAGKYCVTVTEGNTGCTTMGCFEVPGGSGTYEIDFIQQGGCLGGNNGQITAVPQGGGPPYQYSWTAWTGLYPPIAIGNTPTLTGLAPGWYFVTVTDKLGCTVEDWTFLWESPAFSIKASAEPNPVCKGETSTGSVQIVGVPPPGPLTYTWYNGNANPQELNTNEPTVAGLIPGTWGVTVTDGDGCKWPSWFNVKSVPMQIEGQLKHLCFNGAQGTIHVNISGGEKPFTYSWCCGEVFPSGATVYVNSPGTYTVTVTDNIGCMESQSFEIMQSSFLKLSGQVNPTTCSCCNDGSITLLFDGGQAPYALYNGTNGQIYSVPGYQYTMTNLSTGSHHFYATDALGCQGIWYTFNVESSVSPINIEGAQKRFVPLN